MKAHPANDAWEALLSAHSSLIRRFGAEDGWEDVSMKATQRRIGRRHGRSVARAMLADLTPAELRQLTAILEKLNK